MASHRISRPGRVTAKPLLGLVWVYRKAISPLFRAQCRFEPSCSAYAEEALREYGGFKGAWLTLGRIARCHPWGGYGYDPVPLRKTGAQEPDTDLLRERTKVLNHAYGFISRGNRRGGLQHLCDRIGKEADVGEAYRWFFEQILTWEPNEAALDFAQEYLRWLLSKRRDVEALKLIGRCRLENGHFMPRADLRATALAVAERLGNDEFRVYLRPDRCDAGSSGY
jgi:putative membrane protein insertion efficiency factor